VFPVTQNEARSAIGQGMLQAGCPCLHPTNSVKRLKETQTIHPEALKGTQSIDHNQWSGLILSLTTTGLLMERVLIFVTEVG